jgi:hypothetical protein
MAGLNAPAGTGIVTVSHENSRTKKNNLLVSDFMDLDEKISKKKRLVKQTQKRAIYDLCFLAED